MSDGVIDLGSVADRQRAAEAFDQAKLDEAAAANFVAWEKGMQRAFKGIMPRPERMRGLKRALDRQ
jgi:hypothetical protein